MTSMFSVAKFLAMTRGRTGSWRVNSSDNVSLPGDKEVAKDPSPPSAPVASEVVPDKPEPQPSSPQSASITQSEAVSSAPTEEFKTPQEDTPSQSTWTGDENHDVVHEPEETQSLETKVESKAPSERQRSASSTLHDENDLPASTQLKQVEPPKLEGEQNPEKLPETVDIPEAETLSVKDSVPTDAPTHAESHEEKPDPENLTRTEIDPGAAPLEEEGPTDDNSGGHEEPRDVSNEIDDTIEEANHLSDEVSRLREKIRVVTLEKDKALQKAGTESVEMRKRMKVEIEDIRRASKENEEVARRETQRVKGLIAIERHSHSEKAKEFEQEKEELIAALEAAKRETQRVKGLIAIERHSHNERVKEFEQEKDEFVVALEAAKKETQRVKSMIAVERHSHSERAKGFKQEKEEFVTALEAARSHVLATAAEVESQKEQIRGLEGRLEDNREETRELYEKYHEQESTLKRLQEEVVAERDKVLMKDNQMHSQKVVNHSLSTSLVELQSKANRTERHNKMLQEQVRQQSDQLQNRQYADSYASLGRYMAVNTISAFSSLTRGIRRGATTARADAGLKALKQLNDETFQLAATLTDQLEGLDKRFVNGDSLSFFSGPAHHEPIGVRRVKAEYLKSTLGLELINRLEKDAPHPMKDINPFYVQVALQGCLTACCMRIITSWYPSEWEYGRFLEVLYDRIRGTGGLDTALNWRKTTQQNCVPSTPRERNAKLVDYLRDDLRTVLSVSGWTSESDADVLLESAREKLFNLVFLALQLNTMMASGVPGELEPILVERDSPFDWREMRDDCAPDRSKKTDLIPKEESVICAVSLGLKWADGSDVDMPRLLLKPRVVLDSAIIV